MRLFCAPEIIIPDAYGTKNRRRKPAPARKWSRFMAPVSGACVMGIGFNEAQLLL